MNKQMRRKDRALPESEARELLERCEYGTLSTCDEDAQPYAVPLSYIVLDGAVYFHCAHAGQKVDNIKNQPRVCFSVVGKTQPVFTDSFTTYYESAIVFGAASEVTDDAHKTEVLTALAQKYLPDHMNEAPSQIAGSLKATAVWRISIDHITGKAKR